MILCCLWLLPTLISCQSKEERALQDLKELRTEIKEHSAQYTMDDWQKVADDFSALCARLDELELSAAEQKEMNQVKGEIVGYAAQSACQNAAGLLQDVSDQISSFSDGLLNALKPSEPQE
jgi:crotonobetainyl-CoA:carnitine CoA-transferase CaiB-like acyl-CoA transferase